MKILLAALLLTLPGLAVAQPNFETPKAVAIDPAVLKEIEATIAELRKAMESLPDDKDVAIYLKAAELIVRHGEFFTKESPKQTLAVLDAGLARAKALAVGKKPWRDVRGKPVVRAHYSPVDDSIQPYSILLPEEFGKVVKRWPIEIVLHGRDASLTEVKFIAGKEGAKGGQKPNRILVEVYGRGNNAYRWAGEQDVLEVIEHLRRELAETTTDWSNRPVLLRGFSMGGAGSWHLGLHRPGDFLAVSPGAGFTTTHGYIKNLSKLPDYQERCLHIYDAVDYAENAFNVPIVAYSGGIDPQKAAADNIEAALKEFKEPLRFTHLVAPGLEHKQPPEWLAKVEGKFAEYEKAGWEKWPDRVRFVTFTLRYAECSWVRLEGLARHYDRAVVDAVAKGTDAVTVQTTNVTRLSLNRPGKLVHFPLTVTLDGQAVTVNSSGEGLAFEKANGTWTRAKKDPSGVRKVPSLQGPIDDVFHTPFNVYGPEGDGWSAVTDAHAKAGLKRFEYEWDKYFRGKLPMGAKPDRSTIAFGDPASNPVIAAALAKLPIQWTKEKLVVNGVEYDAATHLPVMIYPHPNVPGKYLVLNSGHTFGEADLKGTNALLYPRLGDWAVIKPKPTKADPAAAEVVAAGIFDENWQFAK